MAAPEPPRHPREYVREYIREGLLALVPHYTDGEARTRVHTRQHSYLDPRSVNWLVRITARHFWVDLDQLRRYYSRLLDQRHNLPLPLDAALVLLPLKTREAAAPGEGTTGYMNLPQVAQVLPPPQPGPGPVKPLATVRFTGGLELPCLNTPQTMEARLHQGRQVRREFLQRRQDASPFTGLRYQDMLEVLPPCDCILKSYFLHRFTSPES